MGNSKQPNNIDNIIGQRIGQLRVAKGMTRQKLAELLGITHQQLQKYERGINRITASRLLEVSKNLETPVNYFYEGLEDEIPPEKMERQRLCVEVMQDFISIPGSEQQEAVRNLMKTLANKAS
jgi:transcriptional regulator with XRE-family HTH domain